MKQNAVYITIAGLAVLVIGVIGLFTLNTTSDDTATTANDTNETQAVVEEEATTETTDPEAPLDVVTADDENYTIIVTSNLDGVTADFARFEVESASRSYSKINDDGQTIEFIIYDDAYFTFTEDDGWIKFANTDFQGEADYVGGFTLSEEDIAEIEDEASFKGEEPCGNGTCLVYESVLEGDTAQVKIDKDTSQIIEVSGQDEVYGELTITYDYDTNVAIELPETFIDINSLLGE